MPLTALRFESHAQSSPLAGVAEASDVVVVRTVGPETTVVVVDPLGQGQTALTAGRAAATEVAEQIAAPLPELFAAVHRRARRTAGVSLAIVRIDGERGLLSFAGVGRVYGALVSPNDLSVLTSERGALGVGLARGPLVRTYSWSAGMLVVLAADGLVDVWDLGRLRGCGDLPLGELAKRVGWASGRMPEDASIALIRQLA